MSVDVTDLENSFALLPVAHSQDAACPCSVLAVLFVCAEDHKIRGLLMIEGYKPTAGCCVGTTLTGLSKDGCEM